MSDAAVARTDHELRILEALVDCAHGLSVAVAEAAKMERDQARRLQMFEAFQRGFLAVRMGIRLSIMLRAGARAIPRPAAAPAREALEIERPETERAEIERPDGPERERDRDYEPVSLPKFLSTLGVMASDAARLPGLPAQVRAELLPRLDTLLTRAKGPAAQPSAQPSAPTSAPASHAVALLARPKATPKSALLSATSAFSAQPLAFHGQPRPPPYRFG